jgi:hypothetical protein
LSESGVFLKALPQTANLSSQVKLTSPNMLADILSESARRGTLRHLSIADSPVSARGLQKALSSAGHCLRTFEVLSGVTLHWPSRQRVKEPLCSRLEKIVLANPNNTKAHWLFYWTPKDLPQPERVPVGFFRFEALRTMWLVGLGNLAGMTESAVAGLFERMPLLDEFRLFNSGLSLEVDDARIGADGSIRGSDTSLSGDVIAGIFQGLTQHCPHLSKLSIGRSGSQCRVLNRDLDGSWLRRFADAHPGMQEVGLFITGRFATEAWLYAVSKWAPTLETFTGHFCKQTEDLADERQWVLLAKAPRLECLDCLGLNDAEELVQWMRNQSPKVFPKLRQLTEDPARNRYTAILDYRRCCDRDHDPCYWRNSELEQIVSGLSCLLLV